MNLVPGQDHEATSCVYLYRFLMVALGMCTSDDDDGGRYIMCVRETLFFITRISRMCGPFGSMTIAGIRLCTPGYIRHYVNDDAEMFPAERLCH